MRRVRHARDPQVGVPLRQTLYQWLNERVAYFATVFRLTWSIRAVSDLERLAASIDRISFTVSRGTVISSILPGRARQSNRPGKPYGEGRAPGPRGAALLLKLLIFSCSRCLFPSEHSDHFLVHINTRFYMSLRSNFSSTDTISADTARAPFVNDLLFSRLKSYDGARAVFRYAVVSLRKKLCVTSVQADVSYSFV